MAALKAQSYKQVLEWTCWTSHHTSPVFHNKHTFALFTRNPATMKAHEEKQPGVHYWRKQTVDIGKVNMILL